MVSVPGIYDNGNITLLEMLPGVRFARVIVTVLDDLPENAVKGTGTPAVSDWLNSMRDTGRIVGDIVAPLDPAGEDWELLREIST